MRKPNERLTVAEPVRIESGGADIGSAAGAGQRLSVIYGTSLGTARDIADEIVERASADGFEARSVSMDEALNTLPEDRVIVVVTATYNGRAPDSALGNLPGQNGPTRALRSLASATASGRIIRPFPRKSMPRLRLPARSDCARGGKQTATAISTAGLLPS
jgi:Flavodoxin